MTNLKGVLHSVDWARNIDTALAHASTLSELERAILRVAVWSKQLEILDQGNPSLSFVREMQIAVQSGAALISLCLYKPSAASSRTFFESCLYYTYFRTHLDELSTLVVDPAYYLAKGEIVDYHKTHTAHFKTSQAALNLLPKLEAWYSQVSAVIHGQIPGAWNTHPGLAETSFSQPAHELALRTLLDGEKIVHELLLSTVARRLWAGFAPEAKTYLLKGLAGQTKTLLGLDSK